MHMCKMSDKDLNIMPFKRGLRQLTVREKLEAVKRVHKGDSKASVARMLGVPESTLRGWCKNEAKLISALENSNIYPPLNSVTQNELNRNLSYNATVISRQRVEECGPSESKKTKLVTKDESIPMNSLLSYFLDQPKYNLDSPVTPTTLSDPGYKNKVPRFWDWYKHNSNDSPQLSPKAAEKSNQDADEPLSLVTNKPNLSITLTDISINNNNDSQEYSPLLEAMRHGEKFLSCLENCSDPNITTVQVLQVRNLLNNVRNAAQRKLTKQYVSPQSRRK